MEIPKGTANQMTEALDALEPAWAKNIDATKQFVAGGRECGKTFMRFSNQMRDMIAERIAFNLQWLEAKPNEYCMIVGRLVDFASICDVRDRNDQSEYMTVLGMRVFVSGLVDPLDQRVVLNSHAAKTYMDVIDPEFYTAVKESEDRFNNR